MNEENILSIPKGGTKMENFSVGQISTYSHHKLPLQNKVKSKEGQQKFEGAEHTYIGDHAILHLSNSDQIGTLAQQVPLPLPNDRAFTYGQIVALGGDFYGNPSEPISDGANFDECKHRFMQAFAQFASRTTAAADAPEILKVMEQEVRAVQNKLKAGAQPHEAYDELGDKLSEEWNRITGGFGPGGITPPGRYYLLASTNWDHFGENAITAYKVGHYLALDHALIASKQSDDKQKLLGLKLAYAVSAFADHFLTDLFSSGHLRVPRKELHGRNLVYPYGDFLSRAMHDEDSKFGLIVENEMGHTWRAYGDKRYADTLDSRNREIVQLALQASVNEVFDVFKTGGVNIDTSKYAALKFIPKLALLKKGVDTKNFPPLFYCDNGSETIYCRRVIMSLLTPSWISDWGTIATYNLTEDLVKLVKEGKDPRKPADYVEAPSAPITVNKWTSSKEDLPNWKAGNMVRYAYSFEAGVNESYLGEWLGYVRLSDGFKPILNIPRGPKNITRRKIYRQFHLRDGDAVTIMDPEYVGTIGDNTNLTYVDEKS
ncbi:phospholipase [Pseudomonas sp. P2757]|uniref:phospholipase n=1 Tax=unclassified Pseudomonas TaxID=196821 RepID=UPI003B5CE945